MSYVYYLFAVLCTLALWPAAELAKALGLV